MRNCPHCLNTAVLEDGFCGDCHLWTLLDVKDEECKRHREACEKAAELMKSPTFPYVMDFAEAMEKKLAQNRHKGDRAGWLSCTTDCLWKLLLKEILELQQAIETGDAVAIKKEAADVANFVMMIADKASMPLGEAGSPNPR